MQKAENEAQSNMNKRRGIAAEKKEARLEREEAEKYQQLREELVSGAHYHLREGTIYLIRPERDYSVAI